MKLDLLAAIGALVLARHVSCGFGSPSDLTPRVGCDGGVSLLDGTQSAIIQCNTTQKLQESGFKPQVELDLDKYLGIDNTSQIVYGGVGFYEQAQSIALMPDLMFKIYLKNGKSITVDLNPFVILDVQNNLLRFESTSKNIRKSTDSLSLEINRVDGKVLNVNLKGMLLNTQGEAVSFTYDLLTHLGDSVLIALDPSNTAEDPYLDDDDMYTLVAMSIRRDAVFRFALDRVFSNENGQLVYKDPQDGFWEADGDVVQFVESMPLLGYAIALKHKIQGNPDQAARAIAKCSYATMVAVTATIASVCGAGLPVVGLATYIATRAGMDVEREIADKYITNGKIRGQIPPVEISRIAKEATINILGGKLTGTFNSYILKRTLKPTLGRACTSVGKAMKASEAVVKKVQQDLEKTQAEVIDFTAGNFMTAVGGLYTIDLINALVGIGTIPFQYNDTMGTHAPTQKWTADHLRSPFGDKIPLMPAKLPPPGGKLADEIQQFEGDRPAGAGFILRFKKGAGSDIATTLQTSAATKTKKGKKTKSAVGAAAVSSPTPTGSKGDNSVQVTKKKGKKQKKPKKTKSAA
ncbi:hypothetical protein TWF694_005923 [Orbilia ellipsospora]|uniref:Uncharacterized protein n=1 Tax=Orbilia ellipsospora TaxID=2528407 RepID=A0AAV9WSB1_9PEZI